MESSFVDIMRIKRTMCDDMDKKKGGCHKCPLSQYNNSKKIFCQQFIERYPEEAEQMMIEYKSERPKRRKPKKPEGADNPSGIKEGDTVKVVNWGSSYSTDSGWVANNVEDKRLCAMYAYGDRSNFQKYRGDKRDPRLYKVLKVTNGTEKIYIGRKDYYGYCDVSACYVIGLGGLVKVDEEDDEW